MDPAVSNEGSHNAVGAWFLGPRAENFQHLKDIVNAVLDEQDKARKNYFPNDPLFITKEMQASSEFQEQIDKLKRTIATISSNLSKHSVPFWNPRYLGHMLMDTTLPSIAGYLAGMLYNPNNNAVEASPWTTYMEQEVGLDLAHIVGWQTRPDANPRAWGHITCGGTVANLEAVWAARNIKFYPLSLRLAMEPGRELEFISESFKIKTCRGREKLLADCSPWELLNLNPEEILEIPDRLHLQYRIALPYLTRILEHYSVQTLSRSSRQFEQFGPDMIRNMVLITCATRHYSWPKAAAVTGIGVENTIGITVDYNARMDMAALRRQLDDCVANQRAVYAVVGIMGSTEHGACDPLDEMVKIRDEYRQKGLSFILHADGAWGTYFASMIPRGSRGDGPPLSLALKRTTLNAMNALVRFDTVTVDPHKSGYIQYPAGGLLYRDGRMRHQISITSPIVFRDDAESMGVFGIEGSKPGAAPLATWVSHQVIGLNPKGYGRILGQALYSCVRMYAHLVTMFEDDEDVFIRTLNMLPSEFHNKGDQAIRAEKRLINQRIKYGSNDSLSRNQDALNLLRDMGSDFAINAFAVNFRHKNGKINEDVLEANALNKRIFERLSVNDLSKDFNSVPLYLTSTQMEQGPYGACLTKFKERLGLKGNENLYTLVNVVASPFPTTDGFMEEIETQLKKVIQEEAKIIRDRNDPNYKHLHGWIMQGTEDIHYVHLPVFDHELHRRQLIITGDLPPNVKAEYVAEKKKNPNQYWTIAVADKCTLQEVLDAGSMNAFIVPWRTNDIKWSGFRFTNIKVVVDRSLHKEDLRLEYPRFTMPFYLYGGRTELHIDHALLVRPNIMLCGEQVSLYPAPPALSFPAILHFEGMPEHVMHPFPKNKDIQVDPNFFFRTGQAYNAKITSDMDGKQAPLWRGTITLKGVFIDVDELNYADAFHHPIRYQAVPGAVHTRSTPPAPATRGGGGGHVHNHADPDANCFLGHALTDEDVEALENEGVKGRLAEIKDL